MTNDLQAPASCCSTGATNPAADANGRGTLLGGTPNASTASSTDSTTCVVMAGTAVDIATAEAAGLYRDYEGNRYHFCCAGCGPAFDADPAKYAASAA